MREIEKARELLDGKLAELNQRLENPAARQTEDGRALEGKFNLQAYISALGQIVEAHDLLDDLQARRPGNGIRRRKAKSGGDTAPTGQRDDR